MELFRQLSASVMALLITYGYWALFGLLFVEEAGVPLPLPGDTLVMYGGYQAHHGHMNGFWVLASAIAGSFCGSMTLYFIALKGGHGLIVRFGKYIHLHPERVEAMERRFERYGIAAIIVARLIPGLRVATTAMAGVFGVPIHIFAPASFIGICIWATVFYILGILVGESYLLLSDALGSYLRVFLIALVAIAALAILIFMLRRRAKSRTKERPQPPFVFVPKGDSPDGC
jgi:membrane protein DedA with SNARE-associated domain